MKLTEERAELAAMDAAALRARLLEEKRSLWMARFALGKRQLEDTATLQKSRKTIARINMYLGAREREEQLAASMTATTTATPTAGDGTNG